jgi:hypothetical protein
MPDLIPLDKLITRMKTDLALSKAYKEKWQTPTRLRVKTKNRTKMSVLFYLEELQKIKACK